MAIVSAAVDLDKNLQDELTCSLCLDFFNNPVLTIKCSHSFCKECISQHCQRAKTKASCPECRGELCPNGLIDNRSLANIVDIIQQKQKIPRAWSGTPEQCWGRLNPSWVEDGGPNGSAELAYGLKDVVKIGELPQQIEAALEAIANWKKDGIEMKENVSQIKSSVSEAFSFLKNYINDSENTALNIIDKVYMAAQQERDLMEDQLQARTDQLLELQTNSEEVIKNTSLEQDICIGSPIEMNDVAVTIQKINRIRNVVEEFQRQLEKSVLWDYSVDSPQESTRGTCWSNGIKMELEDVEMAFSSISTQSQDSLQEASSCALAMSSVTASSSRASLDCLQHAKRRSRSPISRADISSQFSQWASSVTFGLGTLSRSLELSEDNKKVIVSRYPVDYEHSAKRFCNSQVLGCQSFSEGCHYWEVITADSAGWAIGVAREEIGNKDKLGKTERSWCIEWSAGKLSAWHRDRETPISREKPLRVGVFLDMPRNCLSFYSLTDQEIFLHKFEICVAKAVYPAFWIFGMNAGESLTINDIKKP